jgi:putative acetyltransferase
MINIRQETPSDYDAVRRVNMISFGRKNEAELVDRLRKTDSFIPELSLVALEGERIIGHLLITKVHVTSNERSITLLALSPMCVIPEYQNKGVGTRMVEAAIRICRGLNYPAIVVLGHPPFYSRLGFVESGLYGIKSPFDAPPEAYMVYILVEELSGHVAGVVTYPDEFNSL